jgi:G:T-mismatch repair DNA endonuclease (very short patch repair protein)
VTELEAKVAALEARVAQLQARLDSLMGTLYHFANRLADQSYPGTPDVVLKASPAEAECYFNQP